MLKQNVILLIWIRSECISLEMKMSSLCLVVNPNISMFSEHLNYLIILRFYISVNLIIIVRPQQHFGSRKDPQYKIELVIKIDCFVQGLVEHKLR